VTAAESFPRLLLRARLALARFTPIELASGAVVAAVLALGLVVLPAVSGQRAASEAATRDLRQRAAARPVAAASAPAPDLVERRLHDFYATLGDVEHSEDALRTLFAAADQRRVVLDQAEYKLAYDQRGRFYTYSVLLPVVGDYASIRAFSEQVLLAMPFASLDEMDFHRDDIAQTQLKAKLRFTLHFNGPADLPGNIAAAAARGPMR
jgi:hypothetical protein